jgi:hypothetical protein
MKTTFASFVFICSILSASAVLAADPGRWCSDIFPGHQDLIQTKANVGADCDGGLNGLLLDTTPIRTVTIRMRQDGPGGKDRYVTFTPNGLTARGLNKQESDHASDMKAQLDQYLTLHKMKISPAMGFIDVVAVKIDSNVKLYEDLSAVKAVQPKAKESAQLPAGKPLSREMACLSDLNKIPGSKSIKMTFSAGDSGRQPAIVIEGQKHGENTSDIIYTPEGYRYGDYQAGDTAEHLWELPGTTDAPKASWLYTAYSERSWGQPIVYSTPAKDLRPKKRVLSDSTQHDPNGTAMKALYESIRDVTRQVRDEFDTNPRLKSPENTDLLSAAVKSCGKVEGLQPEIGFFAGHVFPSEKAGSTGGSATGSPHVE